MDAVASGRGAAASGRGSLPNLVVIGAMKSGTTSLHKYLDLHPHISMSARKELHFFDENWERGVDWYRTHFDEAAPVRGESCPNYTKFPQHRGVAERIHHVVPEAKLIYLVRDPIERVVSHYVDSCAFGRINVSFVDALATEHGEHMLNCSRYALQLEQYTPYFDRERVLIVEAEALRDRREATLNRVFAFLGLDPELREDEVAATLNSSETMTLKTTLGYRLEGTVGALRGTWLHSKLPTRQARRLLNRYHAATARPIERPHVDGRTLERLRRALSDDTERFRALTGQSFAGWST
jgi:hypothetical protein